MFPNLREIIETAIRNHPPDCIFAPNAIDNIMAAYPDQSSAAATIDWLEAAIKGQEIYCPHEGIDLRKGIVDGNQT